jgi:NAD(P)-dependent dehydrogenase (short-subunit alcohol dehydrogenase family)
MRFAGKVVVVTGGEAGIGAAAVARFATEGAKTVSLDLKLGAAGGTPGTLRIACDVSKSEAVAAAFAEVRAKLGGVDVLVNNAGIQHYGTVVDTSEEEWDHVMNVNLKSAFLCAKHAIPMMLERAGGGGGGGGVVVNLSSVQAFHSQKTVAPYTTSKTALLGLTRSIAVDYAPKVRCVAVCPGTVDTPMLRWAIDKSPDPAAVFRECEQMHLNQRVGNPAEIAGLVAYLASDEAAFINGQFVRIDGGLGISIGGSKQQ